MALRSKRKWKYSFYDVQVKLLLEDFVQMCYLSHFLAFIPHFANKRLVEKMNPARVIVEIGKIVLAQNYKSIVKQFPLLKLSHGIWMLFIPLNLIMGKDKTIFVRKDSPFDTDLVTPLHKSPGWSSLVKL
jgi:hypothetical protein